MGYLRPFEGLEPLKPHVTLVKLKRPKLVEVKYKPFAAVLDKPILLPSAARPRYIALEVSPTEEFAALRRLLEAGLGDAVEERHGEFKPHLTLYAVRLKRPARADLEPALAEAEALSGSSFEVRGVSLIDTAGGEYKVMRELPFAPWA